MSFKSLPILDLDLARDPKTKPFFLSSLRDALLKVGFLYIRNIGISDTLIQDVISQGKAFFDLPQEEKLKIQMRNVPSFLGIFPLPYYFLLSAVQYMSILLHGWTMLTTPCIRLQHPWCGDHSTSPRL